MEPSEKELLDRTYKLARDNNRMLHSMQRSAMLWRIFRILILAVTLGLPIWLYFSYIAPVMEQAQGTSSQFMQLFEMYFSGGE
jgi:hypothetical protein